MKTKLVHFKTSLNYSFILLFLLLVIYGFTNSKNNLKHEYMSIYVEKEHDQQLLYISTESDTIQKIAVVNPKYDISKRKLKKRGFTIKEKIIESVYDNTIVFKMISNFEEKGWVLKSHSFEAELSDKHPDIRVSQYLMSRKSK